MYERERERDLERERERDHQLEAFLMQQAEELNLESITAVSTIPKQPDENPPDDDIIIIPSWLEVVDDIYSTLPAQLPATDDNEELLLQEDDHHDHFQMMENHHIMFDFETNVDVDSAHLLQAPLPTVPADQIDPPLFFLDDHDLYEYLLFHENVPDIDDDDQRTQLPQYSLLQNPQPHVESRSENELDACNIFLLDNDDELLINDLVNINTKENIHDQDNTSEHYHVNNVTTTTTTSTVMPSSNDDHSHVGTSEPRTTDEQIKELGQVHGDEENEADPNSRSSTLNGCKNLVSERNRRTRLSQQLLALRALVPNITKMDKRSVLVDALAYLRSIHEETTRLQKELNEHHQPNLNSIMISTATAPTPNENESSPDYLLGIPRMLTPTDPPKSKAAIITEMETEKIEDGRFIVKITCKSGIGVGGDILRLIESLGFDITHSSLLPKNPQNRHHQQEILITLFIRVKKQEKMTEENLRDCISNRALRLGLTFHQNP